MTTSVGIRLEAAMQAWPLQRRGARRDSHTRPTKSGVIGLVANALGLDFSDSIDDLAVLRFGVRVDRPGLMERDFHTAGGGRFQALPGEVVDPAGKAGLYLGDRCGDPTDPEWLQYETMKDAKPAAGWNLSSNAGGTYLTSDMYLADASFLAALEGPDELIEQIAEALARPARAVFLGRKAYGPSAPLLEATIAGHLEVLFADTLPDTHTDGENRFDVFVEPAGGEPGTVVHDQPISFDGPIRRGARLERHYTLSAAAPAPEPELFDTIFAEGVAS